MMQQALRARLLADGPVSALVGTRVDWDKRPQGSALPCITLSMREERDQTMDGFQVTRKPTVQVHCWALKAADAHNLAEFVIEALVPAADQGVVRFLRSFANIIPVPAEDTDQGQVFRQIVDLQIHHTTIP